MSTDHDIFKHRHVLEETNILKGSGHADGCYPVRLETIYSLCLLLGRMYQDISLSRFINASHTIEEGRLASPIRTNQSHNLTGTDIERDSVDSAQSAKIHGQTFDLK